MTDITIGNFLEGKVSRQEVADFVFTNLWEQGRGSKEAGECLYRGPDGCKCAIGWLIPDDEYRSGHCDNGGMEGHTSLTLVCKFYSKSSDIYTSREFLTGLQLVHDNASDETNFRQTLLDQMYVFYTNHNLDDSIIRKYDEKL